MYQNPKTNQRMLIRIFDLTTADRAYKSYRVWCLEKLKSCSQLLMQVHVN